MFPIPCDEPTVHRVRAFDIDGDGKPEIVHVPLQGRDASAKGNYVSVTVVFEAHSREDYDAAHGALREHPAVKWTL